MSWLLLAGSFGVCNEVRLNLIRQINSYFQYAVYKKDPDLYTDEVLPEERDFLSQILISYKINPHTAFYIGYADDYYGDNFTSITQTDRSIFAKIGYACNF